jgi:hypothetical protein
LNSLHNFDWSISIQRYYPDTSKEFNATTKTAPTTTATKTKTAIT